jgi:hypothetical protein
MYEVGFSHTILAAIPYVALLISYFFDSDAIFFLLFPQCLINIDAALARLYLTCVQR